MKTLLRRKHSSRMRTACFSGMGGGMVPGPMYYIRSMGRVCVVPCPLRRGRVSRGRVSGEEGYPGGRVSRG